MYDPRFNTYALLDPDTTAEHAREVAECEHCNYAAFVRALVPGDPSAGSVAETIHQPGCPALPAEVAEP